MLQNGIIKTTHYNHNKQFKILCRSLLMDCFYPQALDQFFEHPDTATVNLRRKVISSK